MRPLLPSLALTAALLTGTGVSAQAQKGDLDWRPQVASPAYAAEGPLVRVDQGHGSVQTIDGRYAGFAALLRADGYRVDASSGRLDAAALVGVRVLVISNAARPSDGGGRASAFDDAEIDALMDWIERGGSLLLAADHAPHGTAAQALGERLGVRMGLGYAFEMTPEGPTTNLDFQGPALGDHPIMAGRSADERVGHVHTFTGQSLQGPEGSTALLSLPAEAREAADQPTFVKIRAQLDAGAEPAVVLRELSRPALTTQGLAFSRGSGRVVVLGEAGMLTAQIVTFPQEDHREPFRFGLNTPGHDDQQFTLNTLHWLSGLLP